MQAHSVEWLEADGEAPADELDEMTATGTVIAYNYARHGAPNGYVLDSGDFIHTRPEGFAELGWEIGDEVEATGPARALADGLGWVIDVS